VGTRDGAPATAFGADAPALLVDPAALPDHPSAYIPGDRRRALAAGGTLPEHVRGAALFADISGFTPLGEALAGELHTSRRPPSQH
jgi:hypothetical protein